MVLCLLSHLMKKTENVHFFVFLLWFDACNEPPYGDLVVVAEFI